MATPNADDTEPAIPDLQAEESSLDVGMVVKELGSQCERIDALLNGYATSKGDEQDGSVVCKAPVPLPRPLMPSAHPANQSIVRPDPGVMTCRSRRKSLDQGCPPRSDSPNHWQDRQSLKRYSIEVPHERAATPVSISLESSAEIVLTSSQNSPPVGRFGKFMGWLSSSRRDASPSQRSASPTPVESPSSAPLGPRVRSRLSMERPYDASPSPSPRVQDAGRSMDSSGNPPGTWTPTPEPPSSLRLPPVHGAPSRHGSQSNLKLCGHDLGHEAPGAVSPAAIYASSLYSSASPKSPGTPGTPHQQPGALRPTPPRDDHQLRPPPSRGSFDSGRPAFVTRRNSAERAMLVAGHAQAAAPHSISSGNLSVHGCASPPTSAGTMHLI
mmetsp:Transcript_23607/g.51801  ORF Transcript_23607/g.51801 Transcript_23607/m.51801 type:complete len:384 (+) Transcript_23607:63-1214(+)